MRCPKCKRELALEHFQAKRTSKICKQCGDCRAKADVRCARHKNKDPVAYRAKQIAWLKTEKGKEYKQRESDQNTTEDGRAHSRALYAIQKETSRHKLKIKSPAFKKKRKERHAREWEKTKASPGNKLVQYIQVAICGCLDGRRTLSSKIEDNTEFKSTQEIMLHFSSQFEEGMTWEQHSHQGWNIGHRIAKNHYDFSIDEDLKRCWKSANLFPQWATGPTGNCAMYTKFPPEEELLKLRHCWPTSWNDQLPSSDARRAMELKCKAKRKARVTTKRTGSEVKTPQPRKERASKPATPASKRASAAGPPSLYVSLDSGASAM